MFEEQGNVEMERVRCRRVVFTWSIEGAPPGLLGRREALSLMPMSLGVVQISSILNVRLLSKISFEKGKQSKKSSKKLLRSVF